MRLGVTVQVHLAECFCICEVVGQTNFILRDNLNGEVPKTAFIRQHSRPIHILLYSCERLSINSSYPSDLQIRLLLERHFCRLHGHFVGREGGENGGRQPCRGHALACSFLT